MSAINSCFVSIQEFSKKPVVRVAAPALIGSAIAVIAAAYLAHIGASPTKLVGWTVGPAMGGLVLSVAQAMRMESASHSD